MDREASGLISQGWVSETSSQAGNFVFVPPPHSWHLSPRSILTLQHCSLDLPPPDSAASDTGGGCCLYPAPSLESSLQFSFGARHCFKALSLNVPVTGHSPEISSRSKYLGAIPFSLDLPANGKPPRTVHLVLAE